MLVPNQKVKTTWTHANRKYYETLGYYFTEYYDEIYVKPDDLPITSKVKVNVTCDGDNCYELFCIPYFNYTKSIEKYNKYLCKTCATRYGINLKRISNIPNRYEKFISWCEKYEYSPISKKNECQSNKSILYYRCDNHGTQSIHYKNIHMDRKSRCCTSSERLKFSESKILETIEENGSKLLNPEDYIDTRTKNLKIICPSCNDLYLTNFTLYRMSTGFCPNCGFEIGQKSKELSLTKIKYNKYSEKCEKMNYKETLTEKDFSNISSSDNISFICPSHGYIEQSYNHFINNDSTICYKCAKESTANILRLDKYSVSNIISSKNNNVLLNPDEYIKNDKRNLEVLCGTCNKTFLTSLVIYNNNIDGKCPDCSERSYGEYVVALILDKYNVNYTRQESFNGDCHDKKPMPFDFYLPDYNLCIEYEGQGHYEPCFGEGSFKNTILHDSMKNWYCKWNNINLLRIPYWDFNNIESILIEKLNLTYFKSQTKHIKIKYISRKVINK